jgi:subtilisin family serine protease
VGNNGIGVSGVNWNVKIMAIKFLGADGSGSTSAAVNAINYAVAQGATISNNSWGGGGYSSAMNRDL